MADGEGLLAAQQSAAAQIPYRNSQMALQGAETAASSVVNAFFMAQQINSKRQQLENQLMNTQFKMTLDNAKFDNTIHEQAWKHQYELGQEQRRSDTANMNAFVATQKLGLTQALDKQKFDQITTGTESTKDMTDEYSAFIKEHPPGTIEHKTGLQDIIDRHNAALNTKPGAGLAKMWRDTDTKAATDLHRDAKQAHDDFKDNLDAFGKSKEFTLDDFGQPDKVWGKNPDGSRWIAVDKTTKQRLTADQVDAMKDHSGINFHTLTSDQYRVQRKSFDRVSKYLDGDPDKIPSVQKTYETIPQNPADRRPNTTYNSKKGLVIWDGTNARLVNP